MCVSCLLQLKKLKAKQAADKKKEGEEKDEKKEKVTVRKLLDPEVVSYSTFFSAKGLGAACRHGPDPDSHNLRYVVAVVVLVGPLGSVAHLIKALPKF